MRKYKNSKSENSRNKTLNTDYPKQISSFNTISTKPYNITNKRKEIFKNGYNYIYKNINNERSSFTQMNSIIIADNQLKIRKQSRINTDLRNENYVIKEVNIYL